MSTSIPTSAAADVEELTLAARANRAASVKARPFAAWVMATGFLLVAVPLAALTESSRSVSLPLLALLVVSYAAASLVEFEVGAGSAVPTQLLLIPMLFLLPTAWVPLVAAAGFVVGGCVCAVLRKGMCGNPAVLIGSSWYAIGPAAVLLAAGEAPLSWSRWPLYAGAFLAQFLFDAASTAIADTLAYGTRPSLSLRVIGSVYVVDALLTPVGLGFAELAQRNGAAVALVLPLLALFVLFSRDRRARIDGLIELRDAYRGTALILGDVIEADDAYTASHSNGVVALSILVAARLDLDTKTQREVEFTALMHDVGKLRIPNEIIRKPGRLSPAERVVMETHTIEGERLLSRAGGFLAHIGSLVRSCHEWHDGSGYPDRLAGDTIPLVSRIVACCDAYDAMTTDRPYRPALTQQAALAQLEAGAGTQFDPAVCATLARVVGAGSIARVAVLGDDDACRTCAVGTPRNKAA